MDLIEVVSQVISKAETVQARKKVLFLTDFSPNENGFAGPQTAYNFIKLFDDYTCLMLINREHYKEIKPNSEWKRNIHFLLFSYFFPFRTTNRLNAICTKIKEVVNPRFFFFNRKLIKKIKAYNPDTIISIPNSAYNYKAASVLKRKLPNSDLFFYIMDDYKYYDSAYLLKSIGSTFSYLKGWIAISDAMAQLFNTKYASLKSKPYRVIQNPVNLGSLKRKSQKKHLDKVRLVYAGSVYSNHKDTLLSVIDAINSTEAAIELSIFTKEEFRETFKEKESKKVLYKGSLQYKDLLITLPCFDYGLVTETFLPQFSNFARSSIQTKVNDYILCGCLPVVVGPEYGACVHHISKNQLGYKLSNNEARAISDFLGQLITDASYSNAITLAQHYLSNELKEAKSKITDFVL
jgi:hypothetical protein